ncbi:hypothetical protein K6V98_00210 [Collinsella sp. AGMB00827]|uniref:FCS-type domain-containing protein n=1 Tax=Collinsella ureilytica TaxID=2869515 RepID=A0ABS7MID4_9ACTN|nr:hypothetical protein [Collinsella urealyticum]MBY4796793.1 hypothetical protein [Collinsella urealyticum]
MQKRCKWCAAVFQSKTVRAQFCSDRCRKAHNRALRDGTRLKVPATPPAGVDKTVSELEIAYMVSSIHGIAGFFDAAAVAGPENRSDLCRFFSGRLRNMLDEVGLA